MTSVLAWEQVAAVAYRAGFRGSDLVTAVALTEPESSRIPDRVGPRNRNGSRDWGLWQINDDAHPEKLRAGSWSDPQDNAVMAFKVYSEAGGKFTPWVAYKTGRHLPFLLNARNAANKAESGGATVPEIGVTPVAEAGVGSDLGDAVDFITNPRTWLRLAMLVSGAMLILVSLAMFGWNNAPDTAKSVMKMVVTKKLPGKGLAK